jgi:putative glutamine amidotransferase
MKPRIAIPVPNSDAEYSRSTLPEYKRAVEMAGGEAVEIPLTLTNGEAAQLIKSCDAALLPGSPADVDPQKYGAERHPENAAADATRDNVDELLIQDAYNMRKPLLGICYGLQSLNVWRTGTLVQHIESSVVHARPKGASKSEQIMHEVVVDSASRLGKIVGAAVREVGGEWIAIDVNSSHHQAVDTVGDGLKIVARSPKDQVVEAVEGTAADHWVVGVQWHPERMVAEDAVSRAIVEALVAEARGWHERMRKVGPDFETVQKT